jgi:hypothetical protein
MQCRAKEVRHRARRRCGLEQESACAAKGEGGVAQGKVQAWEPARVAQGEARVWARAGVSVRGAGQGADACWSGSRRAWRRARRKRVLEREPACVVQGEARRLDAAQRRELVYAGVRHGRDSARLRGTYHFQVSSTCERIIPNA